MNALPIISPETLKARRQALIASMPDYSLALACARSPVLRNGDCYYPYRPSSPFLYLTGYAQAQAVCLIRKQPNTWDAALFVHQPTASEIRWEGPAPSLSEIETSTGLACYPITQLQPMLASWAKDCNQRFSHPEALDTLKSHHLPPTDTTWLWQTLEVLRLHKSPEERLCLQHAMDCSTAAHKALMAAGRAGVSERYLAALFRHELALQGLDELAYESIVASGSQACYLHYTDHSHVLNDGQCVLVDAGGEYLGYAADISRTWPVSGRFDGRQRDLYQWVLDTQEKVIHHMKPGVTWQQLQTLARTHIAQGCCELGVFPGMALDECLEHHVQDVFMHGFGHHLGLDVHDCCKQQSRPTLEANMVLTVEPGIYLPQDHPRIDPAWAGLGIRIEDNVWVQPDGVDVMTSNCPKTVEEIETWIASQRP